MAQVLETPEQASIADGVTASFPISFTFTAAAEIEVVTVDPETGDRELQVLDVDYTIPAGDWATSGGNVVFLSGHLPVDDARVERRRITPPSQPVPFGDDATFRPTANEQAFDKLTRAAAESAAIQRRALVFPVDETGYVLPPAANRPARMLFGFDANGEAMDFTLTFDGLVTEAGALVTAEGMTQLQAAGDFQDARIVSQGDTQDARVLARGDAQDARVLARGDAQDARVLAQGNTQDTRVVTAGTAQVALVANAGDAEIAEIATRTGASQYASTADALSNGVWSVAITAVGSGGVNGTYAWSTTGGAGTNAAGFLTIAGGVITSVVVTHRGRGYTSAPTIVIAGSPGVTGHTLTPAIAINQPVGSIFSVKDGTGYASFENVAGVATVINPTLYLPSSVEAFYPCDEGAGTTLRDVLRGRTATLTATGGVGTIGWTKDGVLELTGAAFTLPAMNHRAIAIIFQMQEGDDTTRPLFCSSASEQFGRRIAPLAEVTSIRIMDGWGITAPRISTGGEFLSLESGGWQMPCATFAGTRTSTASIGSNFLSPTVRTPNMKIAGIVVFNAAPSDAELRRVANECRRRSAARGIYLSPEDCPEEAILIVSDGESLDEGRFGGVFIGTVTGGTTLNITSALQGVIAEGAEVIRNDVLTAALILPFGTNGTTGSGGLGTYALSASVTNGGATIRTMGLTTAQQNAVADCLYINSFNAPGNFPLSRRFERYSTRPPYANSVPVSSGPVYASGWDVGLRDALIERPNDGRRIHLLKVAKGSTYLTRAGDGSTTTQSFITKASFTGASIVGNVLTVPAQTVPGAIMAGDTLVGVGVAGTPTIAAYGTGGTTGTGGAGTYQLSTSPGNVGPVDMTTGFTLVQSSSRHPGVKPNGGLSSTLLERHLRRQEPLMRSLGIGFTTVIFQTSEGLNDAYLGDLAVPSAAAVQAYLQAKYDYYVQLTGILKPTWLLMMPHLPFGGVLGGPDVDYPNNQAGQSRLNALNFIRAACVAVAAANPGCIFLLDWNDHDMNNGLEYVHPSAAGNVSGGKAIDARLRRRAHFTASISGTVMTVTNIPHGTLQVGDEISEASNATYIPPGTTITSLGTGTGGTGTYNLSASLTFASGPLSTVQLYRKRFTPAV